jgi:coenzyme F420 hydrogenase subunit beta
MGVARRIFAARSADPDLRNRAQSGGVVSALVIRALQEGSIQAALLTKRGSDLLPEGRIVRDPNEVATMAGSSYVVGPTLETLNRNPVQRSERIGLVGLPCQVTALAKMRASMLEKRTPIDQVDLVIGLFCTWALDPGTFIRYLRGQTNGAPIRKMDITPPPERLLKVITDNTSLQISLDEVRPFIRQGCRVCPDMTAELADVSVGAVEGRPGWNTVVLRTRAGEDLFNRAQAVGLIETEVLNEDYLGHLREASRLKKDSALEALRKRMAVPAFDGEPRC